MQLTNGTDVVIYAVGTMVDTAVKTAKILENQGVSATIYDMFSIKPLDQEAVSLARNYKLTVTIEEHNKMGGLGAAVAEVMTEMTGMPRLLRCGIHDSFDLACDYDGLLRQNRLSPDLLAEDILANL